MPLVKTSPKFETVFCQFDPTGYYKSVSHARLADACGLIPLWINPSPSSFQEQVNAGYDYGLYELKGGTVNPDGTYQYPEDPLLHPIAKWERAGEVAYMYEHAIMAFVKDGVTFVTRVD